VAKCFFKLLNKYDIYRAHTDIDIIGPGIVTFEPKTTIGELYFIAVTTPLNAFSFKATFHAYAPFWLGWFSKFSAYTVIVNLARDKVIWDMKQFKRNPLLVKEERSFKEARNWYSKFYSPNSKTFEEAKNSMEW
jgi:cholesterol 7-dehydrogenase